MQFSNACLAIPLDLERVKQLIGTGLVNLESTVAREHEGDRATLYTPLMLSCLFDYDALALILLDHGATYSCAGEQTFTPMDLAARAGSGKTIFVLLHHAASQRLVRERTAVTRALLLALAHNNGGVVDMLLHAASYLPIDLNMSLALPGHGESTALGCARTVGMAERLMRFGATPTVGCLRQCVATNKPDVAKFLIRLLGDSIRADDIAACIMGKDEEADLQLLMEMSVAVRRCSSRERMQLVSRALQQGSGPRLIGFLLEVGGGKKDDISAALNLAVKMGNAQCADLLFSKWKIA